MKVCIKGYLNKNLGDDLFYYIMINRYNDKFISQAYIDYNDILDNNNIEIKKINRRLNRFIKLISLNRFSIEKFYTKKADLSVILGGSMFIEKKDSKLIPNYYLVNKQPYYIIGTNFGPFYTEKYFNNYKNIFKKANDVCFRDNKSYDMFKELPNARQAPDIIFSLDTEKIKISSDNTVVISVIDCEKKINKEAKEIYEKKIEELIYFFSEKKYSVVLMSFCENEGDERAIESIVEKIHSKKVKENIKKYYYKGNIEEALDVIGSCKIVIGSRFHANILGMILGKTVIPMAYSDKTLNVLNDINFKGRIFDIRNLNDFNITTLTKEDLNYKIDVSNQKKNSERHFLRLDEVLSRKCKNEE